MTGSATLSHLIISQERIKTLNNVAYSESARLKCPNCAAEIPDVSRFCLSCGKEVPAPKQVPTPQPIDPDPNGYAMLMFGLSFMMFFFALVPIFLGLWIGAFLMAAIGLLLVASGIYMLRSNKRQIQKMREETSAKIKCRYCGMLNDQAARKCESCGAAL